MPKNVFERTKSGRPAKAIYADGTTMLIFSQVPTQILAKAFFLPPMLSKPLSVFVGPFGNLPLTGPLCDFGGFVAFQPKFVCAV